MSLSANEKLIPASLPAGPEDAEQRSATRYTPLIRAGKITGGSGEFLCVISDVSSTGVSVRLFHPLPPEESFTLEMPNGDRLPIESVWERDCRAGFRFAEPIDLHRILEGRGEWPKRPIRLNLDMPATVAGLTGCFDVNIRNISLQGAQIVCDWRLSLEQRLRLSNHCLPEVHAKVRWRDGKLYGLIFDTTFQFADLARIAAFAQGVSAGR